MCIRDRIGTAEAISIVLGVFVAHTLVSLPRSMLERCV